MTCQDSRCLRTAMVSTPLAPVMACKVKGQGGQTCAICLPQCLGNISVAKLLHLSEEVAQEECQKRNHKQVHQCVGAIHEALCLCARPPITLHPSQEVL